MITIFNRRELLLTMDAKYCARIRDILKANSIPYSMKVTNLQSANGFGSDRRGLGTIGVNMDYTYEYQIFVRKEDYDQALFQIHRT